MSWHIVVDTNVLVSGLLSQNAGSPLASILDGMLSGRLAFLLSPQLLAEYREVLLRPRVQRYHGLNAREVDAILTEIAIHGIWRESSEAVSAPDPKDDHLWRLLSAVPGTLLITGDRILLENPPEYASVLSPRDYLELIR
ncbi:MAG: putative toxin-antitoxin system toxin component, PIN family [Desulfovermiculus sp.]|nr:putative toxin-antitoxin system toxin component, PIN family [Desulfovermiculus sp.]